jgi:hypothetical protein
MALIRISLNNGKIAILFPEQYYRIFQALLNAAERDFEVARVTDHTADGMTDADGKVWMPIEFFSVIVAEKIGERKRRRR